MKIGVPRTILGDYAKSGDVDVHRKPEVTPNEQTNNENVFGDVEVEMPMGASAMSPTRNPSSNRHKEHADGGEPNSLVLCGLAPAAEVAEKTARTAPGERDVTEAQLEAVEARNAALQQVTNDLRQKMWDLQQQNGPNNVNAIPEVSRRGPASTHPPRDEPTRPPHPDEVISFEGNLNAAKTTQREKEEGEEERRRQRLHSATLENIRRAANMSEAQRQQAVEILNSSGDPGEREQLDDPFDVDQLRKTGGRHPSKQPFPSHQRQQRHPAEAGAQPQALPASSPVINQSSTDMNDLYRQQLRNAAMESAARLASTGAQRARDARPHHQRRFSTGTAMWPGV